MQVRFPADKYTIKHSPCFYLHVHFDTNNLSTVLFRRSKKLEFESKDTTSEKNCGTYKAFSYPCTHWKKLYIEPSQDENH